MQSLSLNTFCFKLFANLSSGTDDNFFISPFSISTALTMAYFGAHTETASQLKQLLHLSELSNDQILASNQVYLKYLESINNAVSLNTANKMFIANDFQLLDEFKTTLTNTFRSDSQLVDFSQSSQAAKTINLYVEEKTEKKIQNLIQPDDLNSLTKLVLINAIYFKGNWKHQFNKHQTHVDSFYLRDGSVKKVEMMTLSNKKFQLKEKPAGLKAKTCEFLYKGDQIAMTVILPDKEVNIESIESQVNSDLLNKVFQTPTLDSNVNVMMPKFKIEYKSELAEILTKLGATHAFDSSKADFSKMTQEKGVFISKVIHQAVVEVNEEGTEAAAATAVTMMKRSALAMDFPEEFICDRPFLFVIHDKKSNGVLFMGKYMKPE